MFTPITIFTPNQVQAATITDSNWHGAAANVVDGTVKSMTVMLTLTAADAKQVKKIRAMITDANSQTTIFSDSSNPPPKMGQNVVYRWTGNMKLVVGRKYAMVFRCYGSNGVQIGDPTKVGIPVIPATLNMFTLSGSVVGMPQPYTDYTISGNANFDIKSFTYSIVNGNGNYSLITKQPPNGKTYKLKVRIDNVKNVKKQITVTAYGFMGETATVTKLL